MRRWLVVCIVVAGPSAGGWLLWSRAQRPKPAVSTANSTATNLVPPTDTAAQAPVGVRITVRVVNTTGVRGLARRAMLRLRDFGYDVVDFDSELKSPLERTTIDVHTGHPEWAARVERVMGAADIVTRADTSRYVDLTVRIGRDWKAPTEPLRP
jgi:hypothetical protein